ncbi:MAG TPA: hypothetical protein VHC19_23370 [Pirellulales bacterium]|nr:hypothetical protein [Pirellulales bacterium]
MRFGLRTLLIAVTAVCLALGMVCDRAYRQKRAVDDILASGGRVSYREAGGWLTLDRLWLGRDFFQPVTKVFWAGAAIEDDDLACIRALPGLDMLSLASTPVTDAGLMHLESLHAAVLIDLRFTQVTDNGVARLRRELPQAKILLHNDVE